MLMLECHNAERRYAECHNAERRYAECHNAERRYAECRGALSLSPSLSFFISFSLFRTNFSLSVVFVSHLSCIHSSLSLSLSLSLLLLPLSFSLYS
jgi:hypothetical protein